MKKIASLIICLTLCLAVLTSCGGEKTPIVTTSVTEDTAVQTEDATISTTSGKNYDEVTAEAATTDDVPAETANAEVTEPAVTTADETVAETTAAQATEKVEAIDTTAKTEPSAPAEDDAANVAAALEAELAALKSGNFSENTYMSNSPFAKEDAATHAALYAKFEYSVGEVTVVDADTATVKADIKMVNVAKALTAYMTEIMAHTNEENWDEDFSVFYELLSGEKATVDEYNITVNMTKTENGWTISEENNDDLANAITGGLRTSDLLG